MCHLLLKCRLISFFASANVIEFMVTVGGETIALWAPWSALSFPGMPICPGIHTKWMCLYFFLARKVSSWISFVISGWLRMFVMAIRLLSESPSIINFVWWFAYSVFIYFTALYITASLLLKILRLEVKVCALLFDCLLSLRA